jgi:hypothetical protein
MDLWTWRRPLRFTVGPGKVHLRIVSGEEIQKAKAKLEAMRRPIVASTGLREVAAE